MVQQGQETSPGLGMQGFPVGGYPGMNRQQRLSQGSASQQSGGHTPVGGLQMTSFNQSGGLLGSEMEDDTSVQSGSSPMQAHGKCVCVCVCVCVWCMVCVFGGGVCFLHSL